MSFANISLEEVTAIVNSGETTKETLIAVARDRFFSHNADRMSRPALIRSIEEWAKNEETHNIIARLAGGKV